MPRLPTKSTFQRYFFSVLVSGVSLFSVGCQKVSSPTSGPARELGLPPRTSAEAEIVEREAWIASGVGEKELREVLNSDCYESETIFISCVMGVNASLSYFSGFEFAPISYWLKHPKMIKQVLRTIDGFQIVQIEGKGDQKLLGSLKEIYDDRRAVTREVYDSIKPEYSKKLLNFDTVRTILLDVARVVGKEKGIGVGAEALLYNSYLNGYLKATDHLSSVEPTAFLQWRNKQAVVDSSADEFLGWGDVIYVDYSLMVRRLHPDSPAALAGLRQGDRILSVDGLRLSEHGIYGLYNALSNSKNTNGKRILDIKKADGSYRSLQVPVAFTHRLTPNVSYEKYTHNGLPYRRIRIETFYAEKICASVRALWLEDTEREKVAGYILDLRGNLGGYEVETICVAGIFLGSQKVVAYVRSLSNDAKKPLLSENVSESETQILTKAPLVILVNGSSASASEMLTGALTYHLDAATVGEKTFGKGSSSYGYPNKPAPNLTLWITGAIFYSPFQDPETKRYLTHNRVGIIPDFQVPWRRGATAAERFAIRSDAFDANPTQLENDPIQPTKLERNQKIKNCINQKWIDDEETRGFGTLEQSDYQLAYGKEVLRCLPLSR